MEGKTIMANYIEFKEVMPHPGGVFLISNKRFGDVLGHIEWYAPWRRYVVAFQEDTVWSQDCLADVAEFLRSLPK